MAETYKIVRGYRDSYKRRVIARGLTLEEMITARFINQAIELYRDEPLYDEEISSRDGFPWRCNIWEKRGDWPLFATAWGKTRTEAMSKANSIISACKFVRWDRE